MNLHGIVSSAIGCVNPNTLGSIQVSLGNMQNPNGDGTLIPTYRNVPQVPMQVQSLSSEDIRQVDGLNLQGRMAALYINGNINGLVRISNKGGDIITMPDGSIWLVAIVLENWPDWCKVAVTLQNGS